MNIFANPSNLKAQALQIGDRNYTIECVADIDVIIDEITDDEFNTDERLPYFATLWPSAIGLAEYMTKHVDCHKKSVLELGCGLGLNGLNCAARGAAVTFTDYEADALTLAERNINANKLGTHAYALVDWREPQLAGEFDIIIAADVLYEDRFLEPVHNMLATYLKPSGKAFIAEPDRAVARPFFELLSSSGYSCKQYKQRINYENKEHFISIYEIN